MAQDWKEQLIASLKEAPAPHDRAAARAQALERGWTELEATYSEAIRTIADGLGIALEAWGRVEDGRVRWSYGGRQLAVYVDRAGERCVVTFDHGRGLEMFPLVPEPDGATAGGRTRFLDDGGAPVSLDELCERTVTWLFRGL